MRVLHVSEEVCHTAMDAPNLPRHRLRYEPKEIRGVRDGTGKTRDPTQGGAPESLHRVPRPKKLAGKYTSMSVTVIAASLYTHTYHMYKKNSQYQKAGHSSTPTPVAPNNELCSEIELWLDARSRMNGASWHNAAHHPSSSQGPQMHPSRAGGELTRSSWLR